jgi:hypothetical protein
MEAIFNIDYKKLWQEESLPTTDAQDDILIEFIDEHGYEPAVFTPGYQPQFYPALNVITYYVERNADESLPDSQRFARHGFQL